ncbi:hypothetical protein BCR41DRAFT_363337 [Lobosporangium transversale]|uniref:Uncharacterized protein n=1 Tax=Lobosporangium transversale TaxID=64571 RepID=A0A1Y2G7V9_9FUNG|nr:hypothetical protein BCR41DRAFT_363337 [Lobosporangium transversale]ORZ01939.1 hypothetical protein BCR41DRAFT_363337 [Lobosporangium transversale]|eukprot:XP_021876192.1 hypothetical protein BCR41DRAFT_363337 [Lobosporangium transversale]
MKRSNDNPLVSFTLLLIPYHSFFSYPFFLQLFIYPLLPSHPLHSLSALCFSLIALSTDSVEIALFFLSPLHLLHIYRKGVKEFFSLFSIHLYPLVPTSPMNQCQFVPGNKARVLSKAQTFTLNLNAFIR